MLLGDLVQNRTFVARKNSRDQSRHFSFLLKYNFTLLF